MSGVAGGGKARNEYDRETTEQEGNGPTLVSGPPHFATLVSSVNLLHTFPIPFPTPSSLISAPKGPAFGRMSEGSGVRMGGKGRKQPRDEDMNQP